MCLWSAVMITSVFVLPLRAYALSCNVTAKVGENVTIPCNNKRMIVTTADWAFKPQSSSKQENEICTGRVCKLKSRYHVDAGKDFQLLIYLVQMNDSGRYTCITFDRFSDHRHVTELCIIEEPHSPVGQQPLDSTITYLSTTATSSPPLSSTDIPLVAVVIMVTVSVCLTVVAVMGSTVYCCVKVRRQTRKSRQKEKLLESQEPEETELSKQIKPIIIPTATPGHLVSEKIDALILSESFILLFRDEFLRQSNNNGCYELSVKSAFTAVAAESESWLAILRDNSALKHRLRRHLYCERSGYTKRPTRVDVLQQVSFNCRAMGVAVCGGLTYIIHEEMGAICVINGETKMINVKGMKSPVDIVACTAADVRFSRLYVADEEERCIWSVPVPTGDSSKWKVFNHVSPKSLSIKGGSLLVTTDAPVLFKYASNGAELTKVPLGENTEALHAVETARSTLIVCCKRRRGHQIVEFSLDGQEITKVICEPRLMRFPSYLYQHSDGRLLVADSESNRILLLDSMLKRGCTTILNRQKDGIVAPRRICIDEDSGKLLIVDGSSHSVQRFAVTLPTRVLH